MTPPITLLDQAVARRDLSGAFPPPVRPAAFTVASRHLQPLDDLDEDFAVDATDADAFENPVFVFAADADCPTPELCGTSGCCGACQPPAA